MLHNTVLLPQNHANPTRCGHGGLQSTCSNPLLRSKNVMQDSRLGTMVEMPPEAKHVLGLMRHGVSGSKKMKNCCA